jgi:hypothetical protein
MDPVCRSEKVLLLPIIGLLGDRALVPFGRQGAIFVQPGGELHLLDPSRSFGSRHPYIYGTHYGFAPRGAVARRPWGKELMYSSGVAASDDDMCGGLRMGDV